MLEQIQDDKINLKEFFVILNHWRMILLSTILVGFIAFVVSEFLMTPQYESTSQLYVLSKSTSITSLSDLQLGSSLTDDYMVVVSSRPVVEQVIYNLGLDETYKTLVSRISLENPTNSRILQITVQDPDPEKAKMIADELADVVSAFISEKMDQDPPTVIQYGYADGVPVSPNVGKNTFLGLIAGAFISIVVVLVLYMLNDTIMDAEDIDRKLGLTVLGTIMLEDDEEVEKTDGMSNIRRILEETKTQLKRWGK